MYPVEDVAEYLISKGYHYGRDQVTHLKLQKLLYYAQAFCLANYDKLLFNNDIEAWVHGPVIQVIYDKYKSYDRFDNLYSRECKKDFKFDSNVIELLNAVWIVYGRFSDPQLEYIVHREAPWIEAREVSGVKPWERSNEIISVNSLREFYREKYKINGDVQNDQER